MPDAYTLFVRTTRCACGQLHTTSELMEVDVNDRRGRSMKPALSFEKGRAIEKIALPPRITPVCHICVDTAPTPDYEAARRWQETLAKKKLEEQAAARAAKAAARKQVTLDDLA